MSTSAIQEKQRTTLPADISEAAGLKPGDQIEWRFENGEIRGRKLAVPEPRRIIARLIRQGGSLVCDTSDYTIDPKDIAAAVREERNR